MLIQQIRRVVADPTARSFRVVGDDFHGLTFVDLKQAAAEYDEALRAVPAGLRDAVERAGFSTPDGTLFVWHSRAMSEEGSPTSFLTRIAPDGTTTMTGGRTHGVILGVVPDGDGVALWRTPLGGHRGHVTTMQWLARDLSLGPASTMQRENNV